MRRNRFRIWQPLLTGAAIALIVAAPLSAQDLDGLFTDTPDEPVAPTLGTSWRLSVSAGPFVHGGVRADLSRDSESGAVLNAALGRPVGAQTVWELGASFYDLNPADFDLSVIQLRSQWRWYPGLTLPQKDQFFLQGGGTILGADGHRHHTRVGLGISADLGVDWFHSEARSYFIQAGFSILTIFGDDPRPPGPAPPWQASTATVIIEPAPIGLMGQVVVGVRVGL